MIPQQAPERPLAVLVALQTVAGIAAFVMALVAALFGGGGSVPTWLGLIVTVGVGVLSAFSVRWFRRRPIPVGAFDAYRQTALVRFLIAIDPAVVGTIMSFAGESVWPAVVGAMIAVITLALAPASAEDYVRHQIISIEEAQQVPEEEWGIADPNAVPPWDQLEEGHGHPE
jgi:hypothetical protein